MFQKILETSSNGTPLPCPVERKLEGVWGAPSAEGDGGACAGAGRGGTYSKGKMQQTVSMVIPLYLNYSLP